MRGSDIFVLLRVSSHQIRHIYLLRSTAASIRPSPRPPRKINSFVHFPTVEQRSLYILCCTLTSCLRLCGLFSSGSPTLIKIPGPALSLSVTQSAFASTSDRPLCFPRACVGLIGPRPSDYPHALSACYYFLQAVFLLALGLWSSLPARQLSLDTYYSFLTFSVFFFFFFLSTERIDESYIKAPTATSNCRLTTSEDAWAFFGR